MDKNSTAPWIWMMDWCEKNGYPPAQKWAWDLAEKAFKESKENING